MDTLEKMVSLLIALALARRNFAKAKFSRDTIREKKMKQLEESLTQYNDDFKKAEQALYEADKAAREHALSMFKTDDIKKGAGWQIIIGHVVNYKKTGEELRDWCIQKMPGVLEINDKRFKTAVENNLISKDIATWEEAPEVRIASDLSAYIDKQEPA